MIYDEVLELVALSKGGINFVQAYSLPLMVRKYYRERYREVYTNT